MSEPIDLSKKVLLLQPEAALEVSPPVQRYRWLATHDGEPDSPPCDFCRREVPCECDRQVDADSCMCTCGRCMAPYPWESV